MDLNYFKTAISHHRNGNWNKAKEIYEHLLKSNPNNYAVLQNYGPLLSQLKEYKLAKNIFKKCLELQPKDSLLLYNYAKFYHDQKIFDKAIKFYNDSFYINPKNDLSQYNIGNIYLQKGEYKEAIEYFTKSLKINPKNFFAYNNIGLAYKRMGDFEEALKFYKEAINLNNEFADGHTNYGTVLLKLNQLELGFEEYEWRKKSKTFSDYQSYRDLKIQTPIWKGEEIIGKTILIFAEQGIGDLIQFSRYLFVLKEKYKCKVILKLKQDLSSFFNEKDFRIIPEDEKIPHHDIHNHLASLPGIFYKKYKNFPKTVNFIRENSSKTKKWSDILNKYKGLKIGINSHSTATVGERIIPLNIFNYLTKIKKINFFIIQKDFDQNKLKFINDNLNVHYFKDMDSSGKPFEDTIGIVKNLDLVITADTSLAHLSATLEKPTWVALPFVSDWRWFKQEKKSVWYKSVSLYRQKKIGDWDSVFKIMEKDLKKI
ncbi:MAG: hypothetical protein CMI79_02020 [Candidatus Pelagibacter sp.]|nr:hypothetical protein [Candidatus Pelagibacter sp.]|tara:strand:- start:4214 stop:5665 length:1452 start_codon:yes stop_codon:yes gene_type:complete